MDSKEYIDGYIARARKAQAEFEKMSQEEVDMLVELGWQYEGVAWNSGSISDLPLYRLYNPNADCGSHHYTGSVEERDNLVEIGWIYEGIGWFGKLT